MECSLLVLVMSPRAEESESTMKEYIVSADIRTQEMMGLLSKYEIVRRRDCRYYASNMNECMRLDVWDDSLWFTVEQDDFCSFAAKEEQ